MDVFRISDRAVGGVVGVLSLGYLAMAWRIPEFALATVPVQSRTFPLGLGGLMLVLSIGLAARPAPRVSEPVDEDQEARGAPLPPPEGRPLRRFADARLEIVVLVSTTAAYIVAFELLGFVLATVIYLVAMNWYFGFARPVVSVIAAVAVTVGLHLLLAGLLNVRLPTGPLPLPGL